MIVKMASRKLGSTKLWQRNDGYFLQNCIARVVQYKVKLNTYIYRGLKVVY